MRRLLISLRESRGLALVEFAFILPLLLLLIWGALEISRYIIIAQMVDKSSYALANMTAQYMPATDARKSNEISVNAMETQIFPQFERLMAPYDDAADRVAIISSVTKRDGRIRIDWQIAGGGNLQNEATTSIVSGLKPSAIGAGVQGRPVSFPADIANRLATMPENENMLVCETFYHYQPILRGPLNALWGVYRLDITESTLARAMFLRPRTGNLDTLPPTFLKATP